MLSCPNCGQLARNDGSEYANVCTRWPYCTPCDHRDAVTDNRTGIVRCLACGDAASVVSPMAD